MRFVFLFIISIFLVSCLSKSLTNQEYLEYLSSIIIQYQAKNSRVPDNLEEALEQGKVILPNRGDVNGNSLIYVALSPHSFMLRSYGSNNNNDKGLLDDQDVYYVNQRRVTRNEFLLELKKNPIKSFAYGNLFEK